MDFRRFVLSYLPRPPARVLEIGCGDGQLARSLAGDGYEVIAVDPDAPEGPNFRRVTFEAYAPEGRFHAVVASRSLHHVPHLGAALDKVKACLVPQGLLILDEFAWDRLDRETATWLYALRRVHAYHGGEARPATIDQCEEDWRREHRGLHGYDAMREALEARFRELFFEWRPYLFRFFDDADHALERVEREAIEQAAIRAVGFRYVGGQ